MKFSFLEWLVLLLVDLRASLGSEATPNPVKIELQSTEVRSALTDLFDQDDMINWQSNSSVPMLEQLKSMMGNTTVQKCIDLASPTLKSNRSTAFNQFEYSVSFQNCMLQQKWVKQFKTDSTIERRMNVFEKINLFKKYLHFDRKIESEYTHNSDCFYKNRTYVVKVPQLYNDTTCYWTEKHDREGEFWSFWAAYGPDILYTYDYVLNEQGYIQDHINRLWFIVAYIKIIALHYDDPIKLANVIKTAATNKDELTYLEERLDKLEEDIDEIKLAFSGCAGCANEGSHDEVEVLKERAKKAASYLKKFKFSDISEKMKNGVKNAKQFVNALKRINPVEALKKDNLRNALKKIDLVNSMKNVKISNVIKNFNLTNFKKKINITDAIKKINVTNVVEKASNISDTIDDIQDTYDFISEVFEG